MSKQLQMINNYAGGIDLIVERDSGNPMRVSTGKRSIAFWKRLKVVCDIAIAELQERNKAKKKQKKNLEIN
jgi:hypothetical protein